MKYLTSKKLIAPIAILILISIFSLLADEVWAQQLNLPGIPAAAPAAAGGAIVGKALDIGATLVTVVTLLAVLQSVLSGLLSISGFFLDNVFHWNIDIPLVITSVVLPGWTILRDIANAIFILIILWIAFTIIFNLENLGGKKLLARVIIIAILINFSLAMVSIVFQFANALARPFRNAIVGIGPTESRFAMGRGVSDIIIANSRIHNVVNKMSAADQNNLRNSLQNQQEQLRNVPVSSGGDYFGYLGRPMEAQAVGPLAGVLLWAGLNTAIQWAITLGSAAVIGVIAYNWQAVVNLVIGNLFLLVTIFAFVTATIILIARLVAIVFLSVLAPAALLLHATPGKYGQKYWDMWVESVIKWAFFAPAFYFLFYLSLLLLQRMNETQQLGGFTEDLRQMMILVMFVAFLWASIGIAKKMGITVADSFINWGKKAGWGALGLAGGFIGGVGKRVAYPLAGKGAAALEKRIGGIESPFLRRALSIPSTGLRKVASIGREEVLSAQKKYAGMSTQEIQRALGQKAYITGADRTGMLLELVKRQAIAPQPGIRGYGTEQMRESIDQLKSVGAS